MKTAPIQLCCNDKIHGVHKEIISHDSKPRASLRPYISDLATKSFCVHSIEANEMAFIHEMCIYS